MQVSKAIMAHPKRQKLVRELTPQLPGAEVVWDRQNDRWDTGRRAILAHDPRADWHLIVQDDAVLCSSFPLGVERALASVPPGQPVSFYIGKTRPYASFIRKSIAEAQREGKPWIVMRGPLWGVAVALPVSLIEEMVKECDPSPIPNYDMRMAEWFSSKGIQCWYSIPSLVDHRTGPENPSLVPERGASQGRTAWSFLGRGDPLAIPWDNGAWWAGDPSEPWLEGNTCSQCLERFDDLSGVMIHAFEEHDLGPVDFLASTPYHAASLRTLRARLPVEMRGEFYVVGAEVSERVSFPHERLMRKNAARKLRSGNFTVVGAARDLKYAHRRSAWSLVEGEAN